MALFYKSSNTKKYSHEIEGVRIKIRLSHIFLKNELRVFFIRKPDYTSFGFVTISLVSSRRAFFRV